MKNVLILTTGQRDLQIVENNEYFEISKEEMKNFHDELNKLLNNNLLNWSCVQKNAKGIGRLKTPNTDKNKSVSVTFPIIENLFDYISKNEIKIDKVYVFYTDRRHFKDSVDYKFIKEEPYLTSKIFLNFYDDIIRFYNLKDIKEEPESINIGEKIDNLNDYSKTYPFFNSFFDKLKEDEINKVYVAAAGGIPAIRNIIEDLTTLNYPKNSIIFEQNFKDNIKLSEYHKYKRFYRELNLLKSNIKNQDFSKAVKIYEQMRIKKNPKIRNLLRLANNIFFIDEKIALDNLEILKEHDFKDKEKLLSISGVVENIRKHSVFITLMRFLQVYKQGNYWAASTILITLFEVFFEEILEKYYPGSVMEEKNYKYFVWKKINPKWNYEEFLNQRVFARHNTETDKLLNNWKSIEIIINSILPKNRNKIFDFMKKYFLKEIFSLKIKRNELIHYGLGVFKKDINSFLRIKNTNDALKSNVIIEIFEELKKHNSDYFNWLEFFETELIKEADKLKPEFK